MSATQSNEAGGSTRIKYPGKHDVMLGRGGDSNYHVGNIAFRHLVQDYKERFRQGSRAERRQMIEEVVQKWRNQEPPGRFVAKKTSSKGEIYWEDVGDELAKKRASKSLAEWTPQGSFFDIEPKALSGMKRQGSEPALGAAASESLGRPDLKRLNSNEEQQQHTIQMPQAPSLESGLARSVPQQAAFPAAATQPQAANIGLQKQQQHHQQVGYASIVGGNRLQVPPSPRQELRIRQLKSESQKKALASEEQQHRLRSLPTAAELAASIFTDDSNNGEDSNGSGSSSERK